MCVKYNILGDSDSYILSGYIKIIINIEIYLQYLPELPQQSNKNKTKHGKENFQKHINTVCTKTASKVL